MICDVYLPDGSPFAGCEHILENYLRAKRQEWADYISHVHPWEQERYLAEY